MLLKDFVVGLRKEIDREEWSGQLFLLPPDIQNWQIVETIPMYEIGNPTPIIEQFHQHEISIERWAFSRQYTATIEEWRTIEPYLTPQITVSGIDITKDPAYEEIFECLKALKEVSDKSLKTLSKEQLKRFILGNVWRLGHIIVSARYAIYQNTLYTHEECKQEAIYIAKRNTNENT